MLRREGRSEIMAKKVITSLGGIVAHAMSLGLASRNPVREAVQYGRRRNRLAKRHQTRLEVGVDIPSKDELRAILAHAPDRWRPLIVTAVFTGLRASELRGLTWDDVDLTRATLRVRQRADRWNAIGSPKSATSAREVPLVPMVVNALKEWRLACPKGPLGLVFPDDNGNVERLHNISRNALGRAQQAAGMCTSWKAPRYSLHSFRHAAASLFIEQGLSPKRVQALMGHSSIQMTFDVYGHLWPSQDDDQETMRQLQARVVG
jgi:integrase